MKLTQESKFLLGILVATVGFVGIAVWFFSKPTKPIVILKETLIPADTATKGNKDAGTYLVEFSDFQCPACAAFAPTVDMLTEKYKNKLLFAYRHFPLPQHEFAKQAAYIAEAAGGEGKFWETAAMLFKNQSAFSEEFFKTQFPEFSSTDSIKQKVERDLAHAQALNLQSTPTFFLNGAPLTLYSPNDLIKAVEKAVQ